MNKVIQLFSFLFLFTFSLSSSAASGAKPALPFIRGGQVAVPLKGGKKSAERSDVKVVKDVRVLLRKSVTRTTSVKVTFSLQEKPLEVVKTSELLGDGVLWETFLDKVGEYFPDRIITITSHDKTGEDPATCDASKKFERYRGLFSALRNGDSLRRLHIVITTEELDSFCRAVEPCMKVSTPLGAPLSVAEVAKPGACHRSSDASSDASTVSCGAGGGTSHRDDAWSDDEESGELSSAEAATGVESDGDDAW